MVITDNITRIHFEYATIFKISVTSVTTMNRDLFGAVTPERRGSAVGVVTGYGPDDRGVRVLVPVGRVQNFHFYISPRPALGTTYSIGTKGSLQLYCHSLKYQWNTV
jgi:hypothetical protein